MFYFTPSSSITLQRLKVSLCSNVWRRIHRLVKLSFLPELLLEAETATQTLMISIILMNAFTWLLHTRKRSEMHTVSVSIDNSMNECSTLSFRTMTLDSLLIRAFSFLNQCREDIFSNSTVSCYVIKINWVVFRSELHVTTFIDFSW